MIESVIQWLDSAPDLKLGLGIVSVLIVSWLSYQVTRRIILKALLEAVERSRTRIDDLLFDGKVSRRLAFLAPLLVVYYALRWLPGESPFMYSIIEGLILLVILVSFGAFLNRLTAVLEQQEYFAGKPVKSYIQVVLLVIYLIGVIFFIGMVTGTSPLALVGGLGALTAVLVLVFKDTILSFIASLHISTNDLVRVGDWIEVKAFGADGSVADIALHTIKVQNWDKTITVIPTHKLIDVTFKNWRGMQSSGGRRIKRALNIDVTSISFCTPEQLEALRRIDLLRDYIEQKEEEIQAHNLDKKTEGVGAVNARRQTNIGVFRAYIETYLRQHKEVHPDMTLLVRQLAPGSQGLPLELYFFTNTTEWAAYEGIQSDVFDHLLAVVPTFGLRVFQEPSGKDFAGIVGNEGKI